MVGEVALKMSWVCGGSIDDSLLSWLTLGKTIRGLGSLPVLFECFCRQWCCCARHMQLFFFSFSPLVSTTFF